MLTWYRNPTLPSTLALIFWLLILGYRMYFSLSPSRNSSQVVITWIFSPSSSFSFVDSLLLSLPFEFEMYYLVSLSFFEALASAFFSSFSLFSSLPKTLFHPLSSSSFFSLYCEGFRVSIFADSFFL